MNVEGARSPLLSCICGKNMVSYPHLQSCEGTRSPILNNYKSATRPLATPNIGSRNLGNNQRAESVEATGRWNDDSQYQAWPSTGVYNSTMALPTLRLVVAWTETGISTSRQLT